MRRSEIITNISQKTGLPKDMCESVIDALAEAVTTSLIKDGKALIKGFISMEVSERPERKGRNPQTNQVVTFPAVKSVKCKLNRTIKDAINERQGRY